MSLSGSQDTNETNSTIDLANGIKQPPRSYAMCVGCHGSKGEKNTLAPLAKPDLLTKDGIVTALEAYANGTRNTYGKGAIMIGFASRLTTQEIQEIADYLAR